MQTLTGPTAGACDLVWQVALQDGDVGRPWAITGGLAEGGREAGWVEAGCHRESEEGREVLRPAGAGGGRRWGPAPPEATALPAPGQRRGSPSPSCCSVPPVALTTSTAHLRWRPQETQTRSESSCG